MFVLGMILLVLGLLLRFVFPGIISEDLNRGKGIGKIGVIVGIVLLLLGCLVVIPAGKRGVVFNIFAGVQKAPLAEGMHIIMPVVNQVTVMSVRTFKKEVGAEAGSKDLQQVSAVVTLNANLNPEAVSTLFQEVGTDYVGKIIEPAIQEVVKRATAQFTAVELVTRRDVVKSIITEGLTEMLKKNEIVVTEVYITNFSFNADFQKAIELKQEAQQLAQKAENDLIRIKTEQQQKIEEYKAQAEMLRLQGNQITSAMLQKLALEVKMEQAKKWDGVLPKTYIGRGDKNGDIPIITDIRGNQ